MSNDERIMMTNQTPKTETTEASTLKDPPSDEKVPEKPDFHPVDCPCQFPSDPE